MTDKRNAEAEIQAARRAVTVDLIPTDLQQHYEIIAFDVVVEDMGLIGRWAQTGEGKGIVTWTDGSHAETGSCGADPKKIIEAIRPSIPMRVEYEERLESRGSRLRFLPGLRKE